MSRTTIIVPNADLEKLRQKARKLKREFNISHTEALDQVAVNSGFNHWHHVVESAKLTSLTENAYFTGLVIAMDVKDAADFKDPLKRFIEDDQFIHLTKLDFMESCRNEIDEEGRSLGSYLSEEEIEEMVEIDSTNYIYYRFDGPNLPKDPNEVFDLIKECSFWPPMHFWLKGAFYDTFNEPARDSLGQINGVRF